MADAYGSGPYGGNPMEVQVLSPAPFEIERPASAGLFASWIDALQFALPKLAFSCCRKVQDNMKFPNMSRALSRDKFGQTPCFSGPGLIIWPASLPRWTCLDRRASSQSNIRGFAGRAAAASDRRGSPPRALYVAGVASQFVATAGGVTFGLKSLSAGVPREQRPRE